jgi:hypothetical protein
MKPVSKKRTSSRVSRPAIKLDRSKQLGEHRRKPNDPCDIWNQLPPPGCPAIDPLAPLESLDSFDFRKVAQELAVMFAKRPAIDAGIKVIQNFPTEFRYHQVEQLLAQAATLLERAISARAEWQALGEKSFAQWLELKEFCDLDTIHADETTHGYYLMRWEDSGREAEALKETEAGTRAALDFVKDGLTGNVSKPLPPVPTPDLRRNAQLWAQCHSLEMEAEAAGYRKLGAEIKSEYDHCDIGFRRRRTEAARRLNALKALAFTEPRGPYNYEERREQIRKRFVADFRDAQQRLAAISNGMKLIYDHDMKLPDSESIFDDTLISVRASLDWLVRFSSQEQNYVLPISVRRQTSDRWQGGLRSDGRAGAWNFTVPMTLFPSQTHVRLRGVSACVDCDGPNDFFQLAARVPTKGTVMYLSGETSTLDQAEAPITRIARVQTRGCPKIPDTVGVLSLHNVSPIGDWRVCITSSVQPPDITFDPSTDPANSEMDFLGSENKLEDVIIYLHLAVRTQNSGPTRRLRQEQQR